MENIYWLITVTILIVILVYILAFSEHGWRSFKISLPVCTEESATLAKNLQDHVYILSHAIGNRSVDNYQKLNKAANYITVQLKECGYDVEFQNYTVHGKTVKNIIAVKKGTMTQEETIVIGAHYDTYYNPGADDNASGVAGLLELASFMAKRDANRNIEFVAFVNEEPPFFHTLTMGSRVYTKQAKENGKNVKAAVVLEMLGYYSNEINSQRYPRGVGVLYPNRANFIAIVGNAGSRQLVKETMASFKACTAFPVEKIEKNLYGVDFSDNWSFWQEGYPAIMVTDTSFYRNKNYHTQADTYDTLQYESMAEVVKGLGSVVMSLAK